MSENIYIISCESEIWYMVKCTEKQKDIWKEQFKQADPVSRWTFEEMEFSEHSSIMTRINRLAICYNREVPDVFNVI
jgi:hypothetical protein